MEFRDLKTQYLNNKESIDTAIQNVLMGGQFIGGEPVSQLEEKLADYVGIKHCVTCANGTDALQLALMAWGIGEGDAVFVPDFTFFSTAEVVPWVGATPIFVDVDKATFNILPESLEEAVQSVLKAGILTPKAVIAVDLFGQPADFAAIRKITEKYGLLLLEDGAQGFGGKIGEKRACSFGDISTTSFFPAKPLGCYGDGGAVFTDNDEWAELIQSYKVHGKGADKYDNIRIGLNSRLDTMQAAILLAKFDNFKSKEIDAVNRVAGQYSERLEDLVHIPVVQDGFLSSWAQYTIRLETEQYRNALQAYLKECSVPSMIYYVKPLHEQKAFAEFTRFEINLENTEELCKTVLSLPMHPYMALDEIEMVVNAIKRVLVLT